MTFYQDEASLFSVSVMKHTVVTLLVILVLATTGTGSAVWGETSGIVPMLDSEQHAIPAEGGPLVSYSRQIPGTIVSFDMVAVPGGSFDQGSNRRNAGPGESPPLKVDVPPFWIGKYEVTWAEYQVFMQLTGHFEAFEEHGIRKISKENEIDAVTGPSKLYDPSFTFQSGEDPRQPAVSMSQFAAKQYTKWLSLLTGEFYRLPTETEWEYACRAQGQSDYCYGDDAGKLTEYAWFEDNSDYETHRVGLKKPNAWGLFDMHGNAAEWVLDEYREDWYRTQQGRQLSSEETLCWPKRLYPRVLRGGSMNLPAVACRCAARHPSDDDELRSYDPNTPKSPWWLASDQSLEIGFRIVRPLKDIPRKEREKYWQADVSSIRQDVDRRIDEEGRGRRGLVDPQLPEAAVELQKSLKQR